MHRNVASYTLQTTNWNDEWMRAHSYRARSDAQAYWDARSSSYDAADNPSDYVRSFLRACEIEPDERVLDMGCGTGSIAIPLARQGVSVTAADFSEGMLDQLRRRIDKIPAATKSHITTMQLSWEEDWERAGIAPQSFDVVIASRSIATDDFESIFKKMSATAARRCCVTLPTATSPRIDNRILHEIGIDLRYGRAYQYAWNILVNLGYRPACQFIESERDDTYDTEEEAWGSFERMLHAALPNADDRDMETYAKRMKRWIHDHLISNDAAGKTDSKGHAQKRLRLDRPRTFSWAYLAWSTRDRLD